MLLEHKGLAVGEAIGYCQDVKENSGDSMSPSVMSWANDVRKLTTRGEMLLPLLMRSAKRRPWMSTGTAFYYISL